MANAKQKWASSTDYDYYVVGQVVGHIRVQREMPQEVFSEQGNGRDWSRVKSSGSIV